ncbi:hypothetical protein CRV08_15065 [Halarcobacter ebronensis]|uniref:diguanylate cyclase n=1 Tax=Halarcobacter ebronensis TaxID=1462615 RepID=A0A4Q0Y997_9BACT|nr:GGDEF domain-containing protein [Halarcobacter ebronensis]RXJ65519.1 hypothetical protein CRV08_15065 [Halarcobacter ebronensis]
MKKLFILLFFILLSILEASSNQKVYKVAMLKDWKPYYFINKNNKVDGYAVELFEKIAKNKNIKYEYVILNDFKEALRYFKEGKVDIIPNIGITKNREELFLFTQTTDTFFVNIYKREEAHFINSIEDLKNRRVGVIETNVCNKLINRDIGVKKIVFNHFWELISALKAEQIDAFCYPTPLVNSLIDDPKIVPLKMSLKEIQRGVGISKQDAFLLPVLDSAITELKLSGEHKKIYDKWFKKESFIQLTMQETIFTVVTVMGASFTLLLMVFYYLSKKKWLVTKVMLEEEIQKKTNILRIQNKRLKVIHKRLKEQTYKDPLTKIYNRKFFNEKIVELFSFYSRYDYTFSFIIFDIDDFKVINDTYGHIIGDKVLIELTRLVTEKVRANDYFFRVGGEEFVLLLSETNLNEAKEVAEKIREIIETELKIIKDKRITISIGLTEVMENDNSETIYKRADDFLYLAKKSGKNRVVDCN